MWCAFGLRRKLPAAQKGLEARVAPKPHCAGSTAKWSRQQTRTSLKVAVKLMGAGRTQKGRRFPQVVDVFLLGHAQDQDVGFLQALLAATVKRTQTSLLLQGG
jgi:hypothetical protein